MPLHDGKSKNRPKKDIIDEIKKKVKEGYHEVVLTGINIGAYGASMTTKPEESKLADLLSEILKKTEIDRVRLSSMGPEFFDEKLFKVLQNPRICRHIHLSIQSGSDSVLKRMKRHYDVKHMERVIQRLKKDIPGMAITTDIIVGFPEETDREFQETYDFVERNPLAKAHIFPYSIRKGTLAEKMKQVKDDIKKARCKKLEKLTNDQRDDFIKSQIGEETSILWEKKVGGKMMGLTDNYIQVQKKGNEEVKSITIEELTKEMITE